MVGEVAVRLPGFQPKMMLDYGAGPGTAAWAAQEVREGWGGGVVMEGIWRVVGGGGGVEEWRVGREGCRRCSLQVILGGETPTH